MPDSFIQITLLLIPPSVPLKSFPDQASLLLALKVPRERGVSNRKVFCGGLGLLRKDQQNKQRYIMQQMNQKIVEAAYMVSSVLFILALGGLSSPETSRRGNFFGMVGMTLAIVSTFFLDAFQGEYIRFFIAFAIAAIVGTILALTVKMTQMPQMVALLHSFVGAAATLVSIAAYYQNLDRKDLGVKIDLEKLHSIETYVGLWVGAITFSGSVIAFIKFAGLCRTLCEGPMTCLGSCRHLLNLFIMIAITVFLVLFCIDNSEIWLYLNTGLSIILGFHMILAIGAADMPVIVSMLNSYSGWATSASGFLLDNNLLIITGALVGSSGAILSYIMCRAMNRSFVSVLLGGFGSPTTSGEKVDMSAMKYHEFDTDAMIKAINNAKNIVVVPGYGMAASGAHFVVGQLEVELRKRGKKVRFCIHPVAGRLPGHMDILLSDARVPYNLMEQLSKIKGDFERTDLVLVIGANDIVNPIALDPNSPIGGMPVCEVWHARQVVVMKRSMKNKGFAAIDNPLFYKSNTSMYLGDAKKNIGKLVDEFRGEDGAETGADNVVDIQGLVEEEEREDTPEELDEKYPVIKVIGVVRENGENERRVAIAPTLVARFRKLGFGILVESGAGEGAGWTDAYYASKGAKIGNSAMDVAQNCDILVKIREPSDDEYGLYDYPPYSICYINPSRNPDLFQELLSKNNLTAIAMEAVPRITRAQKMDTLSSMANVAGYRAVIEAYNRFPRYSKGVSTAAGKINPSTVFVIGVGVAGLSAIGTAKGLGAIVKAYDTRKPAQEQAASLGAEIVTVNYVEEGGGVGGYAKEMSQGYKDAQADTLRKELPKADIIITTANIPGKPAPRLVEAGVVKRMKPGSVIVDLAAETGGNCELTQKGEVVVDEESGVTIVGLYDLPSRMAQQSSELYSTNVFNLIEELCGAHVNPSNNADNWNLNFDDEIVTDIVVAHKGENRFVPYEEKIRRAQQAAKQPEKKEEKESTQYKGKVAEQNEVLLPKERGESGPVQAGGNWVSLLIAFIVVAICTAAVMVIGWQTNVTFMGHLLAFVLAIFVGYKVIWNVTPALHTPLMSVTNAISGIIVVGAMLQLYGLKSPWEVSAILGLLATGLASINVVGGFMVTQRMLSMFVRI